MEKEGMRQRTFTHQCDKCQFQHNNSLLHTFVCILDFLHANTIIYLLIHFGVGGLIDNHLFYLRKNIFFRFVSFQLCASKPFSIIVSLLLYLILSSIAPNWTLIVHHLLFSIGFACKTNNASHNGNPFHICLFNCLEYYFFRYI